MKDKSLRVLLIEDSEKDARLILRRLKKGGYDPVYEQVRTASAMKKALNEKQWDIILCGYTLPKFNAFSAITVLKKANIDIPLIIVAGAIGETIAVKCMRLGAQDYIMKRNMSRLCPAVARELEDAKVRNKQKQMEEELRDKEQRFRSFVEHSSDIIVLLNVEGIITYINPAIENVLGFNPEERIGASGFELVHPDDIKVVADSFNILARDTNSPVIQIEMRLRHKDGSWRTLDTIGSNFVRNNVVESVIVNYRDITERKRMYEDLYVSEERFRLLSEATFEAIAIHEEGVLLNANDQYFKMFGYEPDEALGKEMISKTFAPEVLESVKKRVATDSLETFESIGLRKDGTRFPMEIRTRKMEYKGRTVRCGAIRDITERKRAEEKLRESEEKYRELVKYAPAGIYEFDYETNRFISVNDVICEYTGYTKDELLTTNFFNLLTEESQKLMLARLEKLMAKENIPQTVEYCIKTKGGGELWVHLSARYIYESGKLKGSTGVVYNITERRQTEEALKKSEAQYRLLANHMKDYVWLMDLNLQWKYVSPSGEKLLGYTLKELQQLPLDKLLTATSYQIVMDVFAKRMETVLTIPYIKTLLELECHCKDGRTLWIEVSLTFIWDDNGKPQSILGEGRDVTERKKAEEALKESEQKYLGLSIIDDLTQLYNSRHFHAQLEKEMERSNRYEQPLTLLLLDLDNFKTFNDIYGHVEGDDVLLRIGQVIKRCLRETDTAYRYGGEEFTIMLPMTTSEEGIVTAKRIQTELRKEVFSPVLGQEVYITVSIGLAQYKPKEEMKAFVNRVDRLMYQAKKEGRDRICPEP